MYAEKTDYDDIEMSSRLRNVLRRNGFESLEGLNLLMLDDAIPAGAKLYYENKIKDCIT